MSRLGDDIELLSNCIERKSQNYNRHWVREGFPASNKLIFSRKRTLESKSSTWTVTVAFNHCITLHRLLWLRWLIYYVIFSVQSDIEVGYNCNDTKQRGLSQGDGMYLLDPDGGNHSNAFPAYCDMTSYNGGWTMCYTTDEYVKPKTEVTYSAQFPYGSDGYRTNCNNIPVSW